MSNTSLRTAVHTHGNIQDYYYWTPPNGGGYASTTWSIPYGWGGSGGGGNSPYIDQPTVSKPIAEKAFGVKETQKVWENGLQKREFPHCCGINILCYFEHLTPEEAEKCIKDHDKRADVGLHLIALNPEQVKKFGKVVEKCGYERFAKFNNPWHGHNHNVSLYGKNVNKK